MWLYDLDEEQIKIVELHHALGILCALAVVNNELSKQRFKQVLLVEDWEEQVTCLNSVFFDVFCYFDVDFLRQL